MVRVSARRVRRSERGIVVMALNCALIRAVPRGQPMGMGVSVARTEKASIRDARNHHPQPHEQHCLGNAAPQTAGVDEVHRVQRHRLDKSLRYTGRGRRSLTIWRTFDSDQVQIVTGS